MKSTEHIVEKLNDLLLLNEEVENAYNKTSEKLKFFDNIAYAKERSLERVEFVRLLRKELEKLDKKDKNQIVLKRRFHFMRMNYRKFFKIENDLDFLDKVYEMEVLCVNKYNELLSQINMPLPLCRLLLKQQDSIQTRLHVIERGEPVSAS